VTVETSSHHIPAPARRRPSRPRRFVWFVIVALLMGGLLFGLWTFNEFKKGMIAKFLAGMARQPPVPVETTIARLDTVERYLSAIGSLQAARQVTVAPETAGRVVQIFFESGARAEAGQPLVQLNDESERASLASYKAQARLAEINLDRASELRRNQAGPQSTVDTTRAQYDAALADIKRTEATIALKLIRSPFAGDLGIRKINLGEIVSTGTQVVTLTDLSKINVNFAVPEQNGGKIRVGQEIRVSIDSVPDREFKGAITVIDPQVGTDTRTLKVQGTLDNVERLLLPGMFASVRAMQPSQIDVVVVPSTAVDHSLYGDSVYVVRETTDDKGETKTAAERVTVVTGPQTREATEIRSGVKAGDKVIISGQVRLSNGAAVAPVDKPSLTAPAKTPTF